MRHAGLACAAITIFAAGACGRLAASSHGAEVVQLVAVDAPPDGAAPSAPRAPVATADAPLAPLETSLDGVWDFAESCHGVSIATSLTIEGSHGELTTTTQDGSRSEAIELRPAPSEHAPEAGALVSRVGHRDAPLFRLVRSDPHVLSRYTLGLHPESVSLGQSDGEGAFRATCTTFVSFIERAELERQAWTRILWDGLSIAYPNKVFRAPLRKTKALAFSAPGVWATSMAGQRAAFGIELAMVRESPPAALGKIVSTAASWPVDGTGPMVAGHRGLEIQMGIEGVGQHHVAIAVKPDETLVVRIAWVDAFANPSLTMSSEMQLAIADRMLSSIAPRDAGDAVRTMHAAGVP